MLIENEFRVTAPMDHTWAYLTDVEKVAPCAPGAELTEVVDDQTWKGKIIMRVGPVTLSFAGTVTMAERDDATHRVVLKAQGQEVKGKGAASAAVTSWLEPGPGDGETTVKMQADITLTGTVAQLSRGLLPDVSAKLTNQFAECLQANMMAEEQTVTAGARSGDGEGVHVGAKLPSPQARPQAIGGIRLGLYAIVKAIARFFSGLFRRASS